MNILINGNAAILSTKSYPITFLEKENIYTFDGKGEVMLTIMSSMAQEESHSISENTLWSVKKRYEEGKFSVAYSNFLGYDKGPDNKLIINKIQSVHGSISLMA